MAVNQFDELLEIQSIVEQLGYAVVLIPKSVDVPIDILSVPIEDDTQDSAMYLNISFYPLGDELDGSEFVQFYFQYPFEIGNDCLDLVLQKLSAVNRELPLGHFNIAEAEDRLYFKYVLALPQNQEVEPLHINDILDMCIYASEYGMEVIAPVIKSC
jgi:hypothetical protein